MKREKIDATILHFSFLSATTFRCATPTPTEFSRKNQIKQTNKQTTTRKQNERRRAHAQTRRESKKSHPPLGLAFFFAGHDI
jgi:hypothetical protein